jgi:type I restriction enzyme, S subunit
MSLAWSEAPMREIAPLVRRPVLPEDDRLYRQIGLRSFGKGVFHKAPTTGLEIGSKRVFAVEPGDLLFNIVFAWEGAIAVASGAERGMIGSHRFLTCVADERKADARFLCYWFTHREGRERLLQASPGGAGRNRTLGVEKLAAIHVPLPPLQEQRRIVTRIEELSAKIVEAQTLGAQLEEKILTIPRALLSHRPSSRTIRIREFATLRTPDVKVEPLEEYHFAGVYCFGRGVFKGQRKAGSEFAYPKLTRLHADNFVYPKLMAWEGALGIVPAECDELVVSPEFPVFEIDKEVMLPEVVDTYFRSPEVWPGLSGQSGGTNVRRRRLNPNDFLNLQMPWPDQETQAAIKECVSRVSAIRAIQSETSVELDAMLPSILDKAFKGEF